MFRNYIKTAFRNLRRNKSYAFINVLGLSIGIAACLLIFLVIRFETSFDNFHEKKGRIYRIASKSFNEDGYVLGGGSAFPVGPGIRAEIPEVTQAARIFLSRGEPITAEIGDVKRKFKAYLFCADPEFFSLFDFPWLYGDPKIVLTKLNHAALTEKTAIKYFGSPEAAMGKTIMRGVRKSETYTVAGIIKDPPPNTDFPLDVVISFVSLENTGIKAILNDWSSTYGQNYTFIE